MMRTHRTLNVRFALALALGLVLLGGGLHLVHFVQERRLAESLLTRADQAEQKGELDVSEKYLARYLSARPEDDQAFGRYAMARSKLASDNSQRLICYEILERAIGRTPARSDLRRRSIELAMEPALGRFRKANEHLAVLLEDSPDDAELEELCGRCHEALAQEVQDSLAEYREAEDWYAKAIAHDFRRVTAYERRAVLLRGPLAKNAGSAQIADSLMDALEVRDGLIARNPESAPAYLARSRYRKAHGLDGSGDDARQALALAPDDPEALLAAAEAAGEAGDLDAARVHLERALTTAEGGSFAKFYQGLAAVESLARRPDAAIAALRRGTTAIPDDLGLLWNLADLLIRVGRAGEADDEVVARLRDRKEVHPAALAFLEGRILIARNRWAEGAERLEHSRAQAGEQPALAELVKQVDLLLVQAYNALMIPDKQVVAARRVLARDPSSTVARLALGTALAGLGRNDEAIAAFDEAAGQGPTAGAALARMLISRNLARPESQRDWAEVDHAVDRAAVGASDPFDAEVLKAIALAARGQVGGARNLFAAIRDRYPDRIQAWALLAYAQDAPEDAVEVLDEATRRLGDRVDLRLLRLGILSRGDDPKPALVALGADLDKFRGDDRLRLEDALAEAYARLGDTDRAAKLWRGVIIGRPKDLRVASNLFDLAAQAGPEADRPEAMVEAVARLRDAEGTNGTLWRYAEATRLLELARRGDSRGIQSARGLIAEIRERRPDWSRASVLEGELDELAGERERALDAYMRAITQGEARPEVIRRTVVMLNDLRRFAEADRILRKLVDDALPSGPLARLATEMSLRNRDQDRALDFASKAVREDSQDPDDLIWLARIHWASGQLAKAESEFRRAVAMAGSNPETHVALVQFLARSGHENRAEEAIRAARQALPADLAPLALARCLDAVGKIEEAEEQFRADLESSPADNSRRLNFGMFYLKIARLRDAEPLFRAVLEASSHAKPAELKAARRALALCLSGERPQEALLLVEMNIRDNPNSLDDRRLKAMIQQSHPGHRREAIRTFEELARQAPPSPAEKFMLARLYSGTNDRAKARSLLAGLLRAEPSNPAYLAAMAEVLLDLERLDEAEGSIARLEEASPKALAMQILKARLLQMRGQGDQASALLESFAESVDVDPLPVASVLESLGHPARAEAMYRLAINRARRPESSLHLAGFLARQARLREALNLCEDAWKTCPPSTVAEACIAILQRGNAEASLSRRVEGWLEKAIGDHPDEIPLRFHQANLYGIQGREREAEVVLRRVAERLPNNGAPLNNLAWLLAIRGDRLPEALGLVNRAIDLEGSTPDYLDTRGLAHIEGGRGDLAIYDLEEAIALSPAADKYLHLARAYSLVGRKVEAREALQKSRDYGLQDEALNPLERPSYRRLLAVLDPP